MGTSLPLRRSRPMRPPVLALVTVAALLASAVLLIPAVPAPAADRPQEPLVEQVEGAIKKGKKYLIDQQSRGGDWEKDAIATRAPGGCTALAMLALLNAGVPPTDPVIKSGLEYLKEKVPQQFTYVVSLRTMVYCLTR